MADGTWRSIERVRVGERIQGRTRVNTVLAYDIVPTLGHQAPWLYEINGAYRNTGDHLTLTRRGWGVIRKAWYEAYAGKTMHGIIYDAEMRCIPMWSAGIALDRVVEYGLGDLVAFGTSEWRRITSLTRIPLDPEVHPRVYSLVADGDGTMLIEGGYVLSAWVDDDKWGAA